MKAFHASRAIIEHPAVLLDFLGKRGVTFLSHDAFKAIGRFEDVYICFRFDVKRFRGNLYLDVDCPRVCFSPQPSEDEVRGVLAQWHRPFKVRDQIGRIIGELGIVPLDAPIDAELDFASLYVGHDAEAIATIQAVRQQQEHISALVEANNFESASYHRNRRDELLDSLYDLCAGIVGPQG